MSTTTDTAPGPSTAALQQTTTVPSHPVEAKHVLKHSIDEYLKPPQAKSSTTTVANNKQVVHKEPKGRSVSGRSSWKARPQPRATSLIRTKLNNQVKSWEQRSQMKQQKQAVKDLQAELSQQKRQEALDKKARRLEQDTRRQENELKALQNCKGVQTLNVNKVGTKLKAMNKKQLRQIKKSRINTKTGVVEYVSPYAK